MDRHGAALGTGSLEELDQVASPAKGLIGGSHLLLGTISDAPGRVIFPVHPTAESIWVPRQPPSGPSTPASIFGFIEPRVHRI